MTLDISEYTPMLKRYYTPRRVEQITYKKFPTLRLLKKRTDWTGTTYEMPIWHESAQAVGHDFATALANKGNGLYDVWQLSRKKIYGFASIDRMTMKASMGDARSFMRAFTAEVDGVLQLLGRELAGKIFRDEAATRSTVSAIGNGDGTNDLITLANRSDVVNFSVGMRLIFSDAGGAPGATLHTPSSGDCVVAKIDRAAGTLTLKTALGGSAFNTGSALTTALAVGDYIHREGDIVTAGTNIGFAGFDSWVPTSAPSGTFKGVDRSQDPEKLGGIRVNGSGMTVEDSLIAASERAFEAGADLSHWVMNPLKFGHLIREAGSKMVRDDAATQKLGTSAFKVATNAGEQVVYADPFCQPDRIYGLSADTWELVSLGPLPEIADDDLKMLRESDADAYEVRMAGYGELGCHVPGHNVVIHSL